MTDEKKVLRFGYRRYPESVETVWGARFIFPDDVLWDRQDAVGPRVKELTDYLNGGALTAAREVARDMANAYVLRSSGEDTVVLYDDGTVRIEANPQRSYGYLYVAAYFLDEVKEVTG